MKPLIQIELHSALSRYALTVARVAGLTNYQSLLIYIYCILTFFPLYCLVLYQFVVSL